MTQPEMVFAILGTAVGVGGAMAAVLGFYARSVIATDVTPVVTRLVVNAENMARHAEEDRVERAAERRETLTILSDLNKIVGNLDNRVTVLERTRAA